MAAEGEVVLNVAQEPTTPSRVGRVLERTPAWVIALVLMAPVMAASFSVGEAAETNQQAKVAAREFLPMVGPAILFLPGVLKRRRWRQLLLLVPLAAATAVGFMLMSRPEWYYRHPCLVVLPELAVLLGVAMGEWLLSPRRGLRRAWYLLLCVVSVAALVSMARRCLWLAGVDLPVPEFAMQYRHVHPLDWPQTLLAAGAWAAIPWALRRGEDRRARPLVLATGLAGVLAAGYLLFFPSLAVQLARWTMRQKGPFRPARAVSYLRDYGSEQDIEAIWKVVETTDWRNVRLVEGGADRFLRSCLGSLLGPKRGGGGRRMRDLLWASPHEGLAWYLAARGAAGEANSPVLLWYAIEGESASCRQACLKELIEMDIPQALFAMLWRLPDREGRLYEREGGLLSEQEHRGLVALFGRDAGRRAEDWTDFYQTHRETIDEMIPRAFSEVNERVLAYVQAHATASRRLSLAEIELARRRAGENADKETMSAARESAARDLAVRRAAWREKGLAALRAEVVRYDREVNEKIARYLPSPPATGPATRTGE